MTQRWKNMILNLHLHNKRRRLLARVLGWSVGGGIEMACRHVEFKLTKIGQYFLHPPHTSSSQRKHDRAYITGRAVNTHAPRAFPVLEQVV